MHELRASGNSRRQSKGDILFTIMGMHTICLNINNKARENFLHTNVMDNHTHMRMLTRPHPQHRSVLSTDHNKFTAGELLFEI